MAGRGRAQLIGLIKAANENRPGNNEHITMRLVERLNIEPLGNSMINFLSFISV